jgi:hypothetical protein
VAKHDLLHIERVGRCSGSKRYGLQCKRMTHWYCERCRRYLCTDHQRTQNCAAIEAAEARNA